VGHVAHMQEMGNACNILVRNLDVVARIIIKWMLKK
jgi:hypothetical protein